MDDGLVTLRLLGGVELVGRDGLPVRPILAQPSRLAVLLYLAAAQPRGFHRKATVRALFWPEADGLHARQALNRAIYVLRQGLGPVLVTRGDDEVGVAEERLTCDVIGFERALDGGNLEAALELYRGDLAPGFLVSDLPDFERWLDATRTRLRERAVGAAIALAAREEAAGKLELAERWAHRAAVLAPYDERAAARRIALLDRMGDRAAALRVFEELRRRLREDLDVDPSPETLALVDAVRARQEPRPPVERPGNGLTKSDPAEGHGAEERVSRLGAVLAPVEATAMAAATPTAPYLGLPRPALVGAVTLALAGVLSALLFRPRPLLLSTTHAVPITSEPGLEFQPALSPDGSLVAFTRVDGRRSIVAVRSVGGAPGGGEIRPAASDPENQTRPIWSPNGERVRYVGFPLAVGRREPFTGPGRNGSAYAWRDVDRLGGPPRALEVPRETQWVAWSRDGARIAFTVAESIFVSDSANHHTRLLAVHPMAWGPHSLAWSPDGRWIAYVNGNPVWPAGWNTAPAEVWLVDSETGKRVRVSDPGHLNVSPAWLDARHLLFVSDLDGRREVYAVEIGSSGTTGPLLKVPGGTDAHSISISADGGRLAVAKFSARQNVRSFPLAASRLLFAHEGSPVTSGSQVVETHDVSPDSKWLAYDSNLNGDADIFKLRLGGGGGGGRAPVPVRTGPTVDFSPRWSPDMREIAYYGGEDGDIWVVAAEGGEPTRLTNMPGSEELPQWAPDGLSLVFRSAQTGRNEAWVVTRERIGGPWSAARQLTDFGCAYQVWARDGSGVICGRPDQTTMTLVSLSGAVLWRRDLAASGLSRLGPPALSPDGKTLYLRAARGSEAGIWALPLTGRAPRLVVTFEDPALLVQSYPGTINVTRDRLYVTVGEFESDVWVMDLVRR